MLPVSALQLTLTPGTVTRVLWVGTVSGTHLALTAANPHQLLVTARPGQLAAPAAVVVSKRAVATRLAVPLLLAVVTPNHVAIPGLSAKVPIVNMLLPIGVVLLTFVMTARDKVAITDQFPPANSVIVSVWLIILALIVVFVPPTARLPVAKLMAVVVPAPVQIPESQVF